MLKRIPLVQILFTVALIVFILTFSIALPIYCRFFYYAHIDALDLTRFGWTSEQIRTAYDQVLDYLTLPGHEFGTGELAHAAEGASHFADCKFLFDLNATALLISFITLAVIIALRIKGVVKSLMIGKFSAVFYAGVTAIALPVIVGALASIDFDKAFEIFHLIFFPGKDNWVFNPYTDQIIRVMPQQFFMNCAILIGVSLFVLALSAIVIDVIRLKKNKTF